LGKEQILLKKKKVKIVKQLSKIDKFIKNLKNPDSSKRYTPQKHWPMG
jgi:hypothetical protein